MAHIDKEETDESLMERVQSGDHQAFAELVQRHTKRFYAAAYRVCSDQDRAEDIVQEAFLKLWQKPHMWKSGQGAKFTSWFYRVVTNTALDAMRKLKPEYGSDTLDIYEDGRQRQDDQMQQDQEQDILESAIQALPERQKLALNLCFYEGLSNKEAADIIGVGVKAVESLLMRAKARLKDELIRTGVLEEPREAKYEQAG